MKLQYKFKQGDCVDCSELSTDQIQAVLDRMWELGADKGEYIEGFYDYYRCLTWCEGDGVTFFASETHDNNLISWEKIMEAQDKANRPASHPTPDSYELFSGTFGGFVERYVEGDKFYALDAGHAFEIQRSQYAMRLKEFYKNGIYIKKEPKWYDNLGDGVLCWVWDEGEEKVVMVVVSYHKNNDEPFKTNCGTFYSLAQPLTKEEAMQYIWSAP